MSAMQMNAQKIFLNATLQDILTVQPRLYPTFDQQFPDMGK
jgi:hypothetical protein